MSTVRTVALWESAYDLKRLSANGLNFCIAKSVIASDGTESFNLVWQSKGLAPRSTIQWTVEYGLNWTLEIPSVDAQVTIGGAWQACSPGQVYDIDSVGLFQSSSVPPQPNALKIGKNGYHYPGTSGIHILVGVRIPGGAENDFEPVYVDKTDLGLGMSAWYQPQEKAQWWYEKDIKSATMITGTVTDICAYDLTDPDSTTNQYYVSTTYVYDTGVWYTSPYPPPSIALTGLLGADTKAPSDITSNTRSRDLDEIRADVDKIIAVLQKMGAYNKSQGPEVFSWKGIVKWATAAAAAHGAAVITAKLKNTYDVEFTLTFLTGTFKITPRPGALSDGQTAAGEVPKQVVTDWNNAVASDAKDNPVNEGIS